MDYEQLGYGKGPRHFHFCLTLTNSLHSTPRCRTRVKLDNTS